MILLENYKFVFIVGWIELEVFDIFVYKHIFFFECLIFIIWF